MDQNSVLERVRNHIVESGFHLGKNEIAVAPYLCDSVHVTLRLQGANGNFGYAKLYTFEGRLNFESNSADAVLMYLADRAVERCVAIETTPDLPDAAFKRASVIEKAAYEINKAKPHIGAYLSDTSERRRSHVQVKLGALELESGRVKLRMKLPTAAAEGMADGYRKLGEIIEFPDCPDHLLHEIKNTGCIFNREGDVFTTYLIHANHVIDDAGLSLTWHRVERAGRKVLASTDHLMISDQWERLSHRLRALANAVSAETPHDMLVADNLTLKQLGQN